MPRAMLLSQLQRRWVVLNLDRVVGNVEMTTALMLLVANMSRRQENCGPGMGHLQGSFDLLVDLHRNQDLARGEWCWLCSRVSLAGIISGGFALLMLYFTSD